MAKLVLLILLIIAISVFAQIPINIPYFEDPVLMTVWGASPELATVSFICDAINLPHDYSPNVTFEVMEKGTGLGGYKSEDTEFSWLYDPGDAYKTLIIVVGSPIGKEEVDFLETERISKLVNLIKKNDGKVLIADIDIDAPENEISLPKIELAKKILPLSDLFILASSPADSYGEILNKNLFDFIQLDNTVELMNLFTSIFGDNRCCD